ncbi:MAG: MATE family efflux transporter [Clostridia bacterium]|nr:MATE family efflux transporter [Clostridia bacterium]
MRPEAAACHDGGSLAILKGTAMVGKDLTRGSVSKTLLAFTVPFILSNVMHTLYSIVDLFIVGQFTDSVQISAVSVGSVLMFTFNFLVTGLGNGATVVTGQVYGAKQKKDMDETVSTVFSTIPLYAIVILLIAIVLRHPLLRLVNTPPESYAATEAYFRICLIGLAFTGMYTAIAATLRGMGDSKGPTFFVGCACAFNIIGDYVLVKVFSMGAAGAALATTSAQGLSVLIGFFYLKRRNFSFDFRPRSFRIYKDKLRRLLIIGIPAALQETVTNVSFLVLEAIINGMGFVVSAAAGVADRLFTVAIVPALSFTAAISSMVAQNSGAGQHRRSRQCLGVGMLYCGAISFVIFLLLAFFPEQIIAAFTKEGEVIRHAVEYMTFYKVDILLFAFANCFLGYINGIGCTRFTMVINLVSSFAVRLPLVWLISRRVGATLYHIGIGLPSASLVQLLLCIGFFFFSRHAREVKAKCSGDLIQ